MQNTFIEAGCALRTIRKHATNIGVALWVSTLLGTAAQAAVLTVGQAGTPCVNPKYSTIGAAVAAASPGDTIAICPALYQEQLTIGKPLTLVGTTNSVSSSETGPYGIDRVYIQPALTASQGSSYVSVITVMNTSGVTIENLAIDASNNTVSGCSPTLSDVYFLNASGKVAVSALSGAELPDVTTCSGLFGNGFGVLVDTDGTRPGPFNVTIEQNSIHDYEQDGIYVVGPGAGLSPAVVNVNITANSISGIGPGSGTLQFGVFLNGAAGEIKGNHISEGTCGTLAFTDCVNLRSEGVTLRSVQAGTVVDGNVITNAQSGIFINGVVQASITNNVISNIEGYDGIDVEGLTNSQIQGNKIFNALPIDNYSCGVYEFSGTGDMGNTIANNAVNDAYCGVGYVTADAVESGTYVDTLYTTYNTDLSPDGLPPVEPGQPAPKTAVRVRSSH
jgi:nitrous oxidase accessory protein NosD